MSAHIAGKLLRGSELSEADKRHVASCPTCQAGLAAERTFDDRLRTAAQRLASAPLPDRVLEEHLAAGPSIFAWAPIAAVVLLVAVAVGLGISSGLPQVGPSQKASPTPAGVFTSTPAETPSSGPTTTPSGSPHQPSIDLVAVSDPDLLHGRFASLVAANGQIMAGGHLCAADGFTCKPAIWHSSDGRQWDPPQTPPHSGDNVVGAIAAGRSGWVAVGDYAWFSTDGSSWTAATGDLTDGLADGGPAYNAEGGCCGVEHNAVAATRSGFVIVGGVGCFKCTGRAAVWLSPDGRSWQRLSYNAAFNDAARSMRSLATLPGGRLVAVGYQSTWTSDDDGRSWQLHAGVFDHAAPMLTTSSDGTTLIAADSNQQTGKGAIWTSKDGIAWEETPVSGLDDCTVQAMVEAQAVLYMSTTCPSGDTLKHKLLRLAEGNQLEPVGLGSVTRSVDDDIFVGGLAALPEGVIAAGATDPTRQVAPTMWITTTP